MSGIQHVSEISGENAKLLKAQTYFCTYQLIHVLMENETLQTKKKRYTEKKNHQLTFANFLQV